MDVATSIVTITVAFILDYLIAAILVGIAFFVLFGHKIKKRYSRASIFALFCIFALLDIYWLPAVYTLDLKLMIGNTEFAEFFNVEEGIRLNELFVISWIDVFIWVIQATVGYHVGRWVYQKFRRQDTTASLG